MAAKVYATEPIHGPDGQRVDIGDELPKEWDAEFVDEMVKAKYAQRGGKRPEPREVRITVHAEMKG